MSHGTYTHIMILRILDYTTEMYTWQETITVSNHPYGWYACILERAYFDYSECSYDVWYVYNKWSTRARTKIVRKRHSIQPTGFSALIPRPAFNGMKKMCKGHGCNQNSHPPVLVRKPLCNQFIHYHISKRVVLGINLFKLRNFAVVEIYIFLQQLIEAV